MSTNIEREIVQMVFDAREFRTGINQSVEDLDRLKKSFDLRRAQESLGELGKASHINFNPIAESLDSINGKLGAMGIVAATVISNITNSILDAAKRLADTIFLQPLKTGLQEYETQLNAVQTILANTAKDGTTLQIVNDALDELNLYADRTIYNFTQMTDSIGRFTAAGVDLDTSVAAIKGIANVAAISGANAEQASRAMYQLSQAMASGTIRLQDWISVENAGMGGAVFQEALIETARVHGVAIDTILEQAGGFRASLQEKWLTSDIMAETLSKFTGDLTDAQLEQMGYTEEQIKGIQKMAETANDAATKIKTLTQLKDTMAEAMQSGWAQTWRLIFGDFEEAKVFWGEVGGIFGSLIENSANARNSVLSLWNAAHGRSDLIKGVINMLHAFVNILQNIGVAWKFVFKPITALDLRKATDTFLKFSESFRAGTENLGPLRSIVAGFAAALDILRLVVLAVLKPFAGLIKQLVPATGSFIDTAASVGDIIVAFRQFAIDTNFFDNIVANVIATLGYLIDRVKEVVHNFMQLGVVKDVTAWIQGLERNDFVKVWNGILFVLKAVIAPFVAIAVAARELYLWLSKLEVVKRIGEWFGQISWESLKEGFRNVADSVSEFIDSISNNDLIKKLNTYFATFDGRRFTAFFRDLKENFGWLSNIFSTLNEKLGTMEKKSGNVGENLDDTGQKVSENVQKVLDSLIEGAKNIDYSKLFDLINTGILAGLAISLKKLAGGTWLADALAGAFGDDSAIGGSIKGALDGLGSTLKSYQSNIKADTLKQIAIAIALLAASILVLTLIDSSKLVAATLAISGMVALLFGASGALGKMNPSQAVTAAIAVSGLAIAIGIISLALRSLAVIEPDRITSTLAALAGGITALIVSMKAIASTDSTGLVKIVGGIIGLSIGISILASAIRRFGEMDPAVLAQGLQGVAITLGLLTATLVSLTRFSEGSLVAASISLVDMALAMLILKQAVQQFGQLPIEEVKQGLLSVAAVLGIFGLFTRILQPAGLFTASLGIVVISAALLIMAEAVKKFGGISWEELLRGLVGLAATLLVVVLAANAMTGALAGAAAMIIMSAALLLLTVALKGIASLGWAGLLIALVGLAGVFLVIGVAGLLLAPIIPVILALAVGMLLMGVAAGLLGLGVMAAAVGLTMLAGSAVAIAGAISLIGGAIIALLPALAGAVANALANFLTVIADNQPKIIEAMQRIIIGMIQGITTLIPQIVGVIWDMIQALLDTILERLPELVQTGFDILLAFLQGIADNIQDVIDTGVDIIVAIIDGINEAIPTLVTKAFETVLSFLNAIADAIEEYMPKIIEAGVKIGTNIVTGLVDGLWGGIETIKTAISDLVVEAIDRFKKMWEINSPSRVTFRMGQGVIKGFVNAFRTSGSQVATALSHFGRNVQNGIGFLLNNAQADIMDALSLNPEITPVLNLDNVAQGAVEIADLLTALSTVTGLSTDELRQQLSIEAQQASADAKGVTFVQNNYSPKALDRATIYRQTRTQVARLGL